MLLAVSAKRSTRRIAPPGGNASGAVTNLPACRLLRSTMKVVAVWFISGALSGFGRARRRRARAAEGQPHGLEIKVVDVEAGRQAAGQMQHDDAVRGGP